MGDLQGQFNGPMLGSGGLVDMGDDYRQPDVTRDVCYSGASGGR